jgi:hypothetical protein
MNTYKKESKGGWGLNSKLNKRLTGIENGNKEEQPLPKFPSQSTMHPGTCYNKNLYTS